MSTTNFINLFVNSNNAKRVALFLIIGYVTFKLWKSFQSSAKKKPSSETSSQDANIKNASNKSKGIPVTETSVIISSAGSKEVNGEYRWFLNSGSWCFFSEDSNKGYSLKADVSINANDAMLKNKINAPATNKYFTISDLEGNVIYYVAPQMHEEYIPNDCTQWIPINGREPSPSLYVNLMNNTEEPNEEEHFGNANMPKINDVSVDKMDTVQEEEEEEDEISDLDANERKYDDDDEEDVNEDQGNGIEEENSDVSDLET